MTSEDEIEWSKFFEWWNENMRPAFYSSPKTHHDSAQHAAWAAWMARKKLESL